MGIASALILYIGSFFFSDSSSLEQKISRQADMVPEELQRRLRQKSKNDSVRKWSKGGSIIDRAIKESLQREVKGKGSSKRSGQSYQRSPAAVDSDEDDDEDYFGNDASMSNRGRVKSSGNNVTPTGTARRTPVHYGPPLPVGATSQGGWNSSRSDSNSSTPATSPTAMRSNLSNTSQSAYSSARNSAAQTPLDSPELHQTSSNRQRRTTKAS
jgi:hypothetical protein